MYFAKICIYIFGFRFNSNCILMIFGRFLDGLKELLSLQVNDKAMLHLFLTGQLTLDRTIGCGFNEK